MSPAPDGRTRVVLVVGTGRSGSTVLANTLAGAPGAVSAGEVRFLWERGLVADRLCGCGAPFSACPFWSEVIAGAFGDPCRLDVSAVAGALDDATRLRRLPRFARHAPAAPDQRPLVAALGAVYRAIAATSAARVVFDSSKLPSYGMLLESVPEIDLYLLHLVRDPRAAAFSWARRKAAPDKGTGGEMQRFGPAKAGALWTVWNAAAEARWGRRPDRYRQVRYEDFVGSPGSVVAGVLEWCGLDPASSPVSATGEVSLGTHHTVAGNPDRLRSGPVHLRLDREWQTAMANRDRAVVTAVALPLMRRYGYR